MTKGRYFIPKPTACDICDETFSITPGTQMIDGATEFGPWACMCHQCYHDFGVGMGEGKGQLYERRELDGEFYLKVEEEGR